MMDYTSDYTDETTETLASRVFYAAKDGMHIVLYTLLSELPADVASRVINQTVHIEQGQYSTALIIAACCGRERVVKILLANYRPNLEVEGCVKFEGCLIESACALWCAAAGGHLNVVKLLVKAGADVNHATKNNSTPIRAACFDGRLDIVRYLSEHHANVHIANKYNNTCMMIAAYKGHLDIVSFLLEQGANPNEKAHCGATALHFAAESGYADIVKELLKYNAKIVNNSVFMTPLKSAAERTKKDVVEYLITHPDVTKIDRIEALELLGASYANDKDNYCLNKAAYYLTMAMEMRYADPDNILPKPPSDPVPAYDNWVESHTLDELQGVLRTPNSIHMESLAIRQRILGITNPELPHPIVFRGAIFADLARFDRCIALWMHALYLRQMTHTSVSKDLLRFAQVFSQMLHVYVDVQFEHVASILSAAILELERNAAIKANPGPKDDIDVIMDEMDCNITTALYLITILTKLLKKCSPEQVFEVKRMVFTVNQMNLRLRDGQSLLHLACNTETPVDDFHTNDICKFPCWQTARLLIRCGADVNTMDVDRNTPLHVIVNYCKPLADFITLHTIISDLKEAGAHLDCVNSRGETPMDRSATGVAEVIIRNLSEPNLKCLAAMAIKTHGIPYRGEVPEHLENFIEWHGTLSSKSAE